jgi:hypothetical protein
MEDEDDLAIVHGKGEHNDQGLCRKDLISPTVDVYGIMPKWKWITNANSFKTYAVPEIKDKTELKYHFWDRCYNLSIEIRVMKCTGNTPFSMINSSGVVSRSPCCVTLSILSINCSRLEYLE